MAQLVAIAGVPHNPLLYRVTRNGIPEDIQATMHHFEHFGGRMRDLDVDSMVIVGSDHFRRFKHDHSPAFAIGALDHYETTYENEIRHFGFDEWSVPGDAEMARALLGDHELPEDVDFAMVNEWVLDHSFSMPALFLRPEWDIPVVPIHTNTNMPPLPRAARFAALGAYLREAINAAPVERKVALVTTGHLATDIGGPKGFLGGPSADAAFDSEAVGWMARGDLAGAVAGCTVERLVAAGNVTPQFMNFLAGLAAADGLPANVAEGTPSRFAAAPFFFWEVDE
ncbi:MAG: hypothetical protein OEM97_05045 [Acidimicrobiia bacterium]|nr:hypothetical protein [Acidimicrobiia bacterium]